MSNDVPVAFARGSFGQRLAYGAMTGVVAGLWLGLSSRVAMRIIARAAGEPLGFSLGGTLEVVAVGLLVGLPGAVAFTFVRRFLRLPRLLAGSGFGLLLYSGLVLFPIPAARSAALGLEAQLPLTLALFAVLFLAYGMLIELLLGRWDSRN